MHPGDIRIERNSLILKMIYKLCTTTATKEL
jgi:hypothetical protein